MRLFARLVSASKLPMRAMTASEPSKAVPVIPAFVVMPSVPDAPVSLARATVSVGGAESRMIVRVNDEETLPALVAVTVNVLLPATSGMGVKVKLPEPSAVPEAIWLLAPSVRTTVAPAVVTPTRVTFARRLL
jgi:hypothetical protein